MRIAQWGEMTEDFLQRLRQATVRRCKEWRTPTDDLGYLTVDFVGEVSELALTIKKLLRERHGMVGSRATMQDVADQVSDVMASLDQLCHHLGIDIEEVTRDKFNRMSERYNLQTRLT
jgi:NTP pyrophosphatase (non-canonical NTP hydrolase)